MKELLNNAKAKISRRNFLRSAALAGTAMALPTNGKAQDQESYNDRIAACDFGEIANGRDVNTYTLPVPKQEGWMAVDVDDKHPSVVLSIGEKLALRNAKDPDTETVVFNKHGNENIAVVSLIQSNVRVRLSDGDIFGVICEQDQQAGAEEVPSRVQDIFQKHMNVQRVDVVGILPDASGYTLSHVKRGEDPYDGIEVGTTNPWPQR